MRQVLKILSIITLTPLAIFFFLVVLVSGNKKYDLAIDLSLFSRAYADVPYVPPGNTGESASEGGTGGAESSSGGTGGDAGGNAAAQGNDASVGVESAEGEGGK